MMAWQHPEGAFGGGLGQTPHLLLPYASACALAITDRGQEEIGIGSIGGLANWIELYLMRVLLVEGSRCSCPSPRSAHAGTGRRHPVVYRLLPGRFPSHCPADQTTTAHPPLLYGEVHILSFGVMLQPYVSQSRPQTKSRSCGGQPACKAWIWRWAGFKGRTNKSVNRCYSWWVRGAFLLLEAVGRR